MITVQTQGTSVRWPQVCACCLAPMTHTVAAAKTKSLYLGLVTVRRTMKITVPYCEPCTRHVTAGGAGEVFKWVLSALVLGPLVGILVAFNLPEGPLRWPAFVAVGCVIPGVLAVVIGVRGWKKLRRPLGPEHVTSGHAVHLADFSADSLTLEARNDGFGRQLAAANGVPIGGR